MSLWSKVRGTIASIFQIGLSGPQIKNNSGVVEVRDSADATFAIVRGADPVASHDFVTKNYGDTNYSGGTSGTTFRRTFLLMGA